VFYGCILTFLVALIRYILAIKAAKNIQARTGLLFYVKPILFIIVGRNL
jgi:hypothetical protein